MFVETVFGIEAIHADGIGDEQQDKAYNGALLCHPKPEGGIPDMRRMGIEPVAQYDAADEADEKPDG